MRASLEQVGENLYPLAKPPVSDRPRRTRPATSPETEPAEDAGRAAGAGAAAVSDPSAIQDPAAYGEAPPMAPPEGFPAYSQPAPPDGAGSRGGLRAVALPPADRLAGRPPEPRARPRVTERLRRWRRRKGFPAYGQPAPPPYPPQQYPAHYYEQPQQYPAHYYEQPQQYPAPTYEQPPGANPPQPEAYPPAPEAYEQPPPGGYLPQQYPAPTYEQPQPPTYEQPQPPTYEQPQPPTYEQPPAQPEPPAHEASFEQPPAAQPPPRPNMQPTGSFRDWAVKLHGSNAADMTAHRGG